MSLGEFELISGYFNKAKVSPDLVVGNGDDAAVIACPPGSRLVVSTDTLVESVHFPQSANPELIARKALRTNLSDMAAMGATPRWFTLALTLPKANASWLESFSRGLFMDADEFGCELVGGDTSKGPLNVAIQMLGLIDKDQAPTCRNGAKSGDLLVVTGTLGDAGAALQENLTAPIESHYFLQRYWLPSPRLSFAQKAAPLINAALDISDGLVADTAHICAQSKLAAQIELNQIPVSDALRQRYGDQAELKALNTGDDYELCMAISEQNLAELFTLAEQENLPITVIGCFTETGTTKTKVEVLDKNSEPINLDRAGYKHF